MATRFIIERLEAYFADHPGGLACAYLFGSFARGDADAGSDVDLGLLYDRPQPATLPSPASRVEDDLERLLGRPVQVVVLDDAPADLVHRVLRDGLLVHESDRSRRVAFEVAARREYFDLLPFLRRYRRTGRVS